MGRNELCGKGRMSGRQKISKNMIKHKIFKCMVLIELHSVLYKDVKEKNLHLSSNSGDNSTSSCNYSSRTHYKIITNITTIFKKHNRYSERQAGYLLLPCSLHVLVCMHVRESELEF